MKIFESRKNKVWLTSEEEVIKRFRDPKAFKIELKTLQKLDGLVSPKIISYSNNEIVMEYLHGELLLDIYTSSNEEEAKRFGSLLAETIVLLRSKLPGRILYDENFRNYIFFKKKLFRVDFEETREGSILEWLSKIMAFACMYELELPQKLAFIEALIEPFPVENDSLLPAFERELVFLSLRWKEPFPQEIFDEVCVGILGKID